MRKRLAIGASLALAVLLGAAHAGEGGAAPLWTDAGAGDTIRNDAGFVFEGTADAPSVHRIGQGGTLINTSAAGIALKGDSRLAFESGARYGGGDGKIALGADSAVMEVRGNLDGADGGTGDGVKRLFADTRLDKGVVRIGGDDFTGDLLLGSGSADGAVRVDADATFAGRVDVKQAALSVAGSADAPVTAEFRRSVAAGSMDIENADVAFGSGVDRVALGEKGFRAGGNSSLTVKGDTKVEGNMVFGSGSRLNMGLNTLDVDGDISFRSGSVYSAQLGADRSSHVIADNVGIDDAMLYVGGLTPEQAANLVVISARDGGELDGKFKSDFFDLELTEDGRGIKIARMRSVDEVTDFASMNDSMRNAAELYERLKNDTTLPEELRVKLLDNLQKATVIAGQDATLGEVAKSQVFAQYASRAGENARVTAQNFVGGIGSRLTAIHETAGGVASGRANASLTDAYCAAEDVDRFWIGGFGAWTRQNDRNGQYGYKYDTRGFILGQDWQRGDLTIGVSGAFSSGELKNNEGYAKTDVETLNIGVYAAYDAVGGLFIDGNVGYGHSWNKSRTQLIGGGEKTGRFSNHSYGAGTNVGYNLEWRDFQITPTAGVQWTRVHQNGWNEGVSDYGLVANWFEETNNDFVEIPLAVRVSHAFQFSNGTILTPEVRAAYIYNAGDSRTAVRMGYMGSNDGTTLYGIDSGRHRGLVGGGLKANINTTVDAFVDYNLEFRGGYRNTNVKTGLGVSF